MAQYEHNSAKFGYFDLDELSGVQNALGQLGKVGPATREALRAELDKQSAEEPPVA